MCGWRLVVPVILLIWQRNPEVPLTSTQNKTQTVSMEIIRGSGEVSSRVVHVTSQVLKSFILKQSKAKKCGKIILGC